MIESTKKRKRSNVKNATRRAIPIFTVLKKVEKMYKFWRAGNTYLIIRRTVSPRLSRWLGPEKVPNNREKNPSPRLSGSRYCKGLLVKNPDNRLT